MPSEYQSLIPGLPDELALDCLVRVPFKFHSPLRSVCRRWHQILTDHSFYRLRNTPSNGEDFVCLVHAIVPHPSAASYPDSNREKEDKTTGPSSRHSPPAYALTLYDVRSATWHRIPPPPQLPAGIPRFSQCVAVGGKLVLLGGWDPATLESVADVYVWDLVRGGGWRRGAAMSAARSFFACAAVGPATVYVAGGHDNNKNALRSADAYDVEADTWRALPPMAEERDECCGVAGEDGRFWVISGYGTDIQGQFVSGAECYDPVQQRWTAVDGVWPFSGISPVSALCWPALPKAAKTPNTESPNFPSLWFFDSSGKSLKEFDGRNKEWKTLTSMPEFVSSSPCVALTGESRATQVFVMGLTTSDGGSHCHQACVLDLPSKKWSQIDTPKEFSGFVYSAASFHL